MCMEHLDKFFDCRVDEKHREVQFEIGGFWTTEEIRPVLDKLSTAALTFIIPRVPFHGLGNMEHLVPQSRETAQAVRDNLMSAKKHGLRRVAIINPPVLMKLQYKRIAEGMEVEFFETEADAKAWLRRPTEAGASEAA